MTEKKHYSAPRVYPLGDPPADDVLPVADALKLAARIVGMAPEHLRVLPVSICETAIEQLRGARYSMVLDAEKLMAAEVYLLKSIGVRSGGSADET